MQQGYGLRTNNETGKNQSPRKEEEEGRRPGIEFLLLFLPRFANVVVVAATRDCSKGDADMPREEHNKIRKSAPFSSYSRQKKVLLPFCLLLLEKGVDFLIF